MPGLHLMFCTVFFALHLQHFPNSPRPNVSIRAVHPPFPVTSITPHHSGVRGLTILTHLRHLGPNAMDRMRET